MDPSVHFVAIETESPACNMDYNIATVLPVVVYRARASYGMLEWTGVSVRTAMNLKMHIHVWEVNFWRRSTMNGCSVAR
jgi:hypothetical protein